MTLSAIITPTFNNEDYTTRCFNSISKNTKDYKIIWVDNGSTPESREKVKTFLDKNNVPYELIQNQKNLGFVKATNQGMKRAMELGTKYLILQNNDTEVYEGWLERMIEVAESDSKIGLVGPLASPCESWQSIDNIAKKIPSLHDLPKYANNPEEYAEIIRERYCGQSCETDTQLAFFSALIKSDVVGEVGFLSEDFGIGFGDDDDYCTRTMAKGWKSFIVKDVFVFHNHRTTFKSIYSDSAIASMRSKNANIFKKKNREYLETNNRKEKSFCDFFVESYFDKNDAIFDFRGKKQGGLSFPIITELANKNKLCLMFDRLYSKEKVIEITVSLIKSNHDLFVVNEKNREIYKINPNENVWIDCIKNLDVLNLIFIKKELSDFVCFISHSFKGGGSERSLIDMIDGLVKRKVICHVFLPAHGNLEEELKKRPVSYSITPLPWWAKSALTGISENETKAKIKKAEERLINEIGVINPDVVYSNTSVVNLGALVAKRLNITHIWHIREFGSKKHGLEFYQGLETAAKFIYDYSDKILFNSKALKDHYKKVIPADKSEVVYNYIGNGENIPIKSKNLNYFKDNENLKMIMIGGVTRGKGQRDAILAVEQLTKNGKNNLELLIVGGVEPEYHKELNGIIEKGKLCDYVKFSGYLDNPFAALAEADLMLMCSQDEAFGRVTAEAVLMRKAVIGANSGGTPELVQEGISGFLYEPENYQELAEKIAHFIDKKDKLEEFGQKGYELAINKFTESQYSGRVAEIIKNLKNTKKRSENFILNQDILNKFFKVRKKNKQLEKAKEGISRCFFLFKKSLVILKREGIFTFFIYIYKFVRYGRNYFR